MSETILKDLELVEVEYNDSKMKATLSFVDRENGELREVNFNKQVFDGDKKKWKDDSEKAEKVENWSKEYFDTTFDTLDSAIGTKHDVYAYDKFCSMFHVDQVEKFTDEQVGTMLSSQITDIFDDGIALKIRYDIDGAVHETKYTYAKFLEQTKEWLPNPITKTKKLEKFEGIFHVPFEKAESLIGTDIMIEVKSAFGKFPYGEIKKLPQ